MNITYKNIAFAIIIVSGICLSSYVIFIYREPLPHPNKITLEGYGAWLISTAQSTILRCYSPEINVTLKFYERASAILIITNAPPIVCCLDGKIISMHKLRTMYQQEFLVYNGTKVSITTDPAIITSDYHFAVIGDTQGNPNTLRAFVEDLKSNNDIEPVFVIHLGDFTASGTYDQFNTYTACISGMDIPVYGVPGNHDIREGVKNFLDVNGASNNSFRWKNDHFLLLNTSLAELSSDQMRWANATVQEKDARYRFIFMHIPPFDPQSAENHAFLNKSHAQETLTKINGLKPTMVFNGHLHFFNQTEYNGYSWITTGGGGGSFYANETDGGYYHYLDVSVSSTNVTYSIQKITVSVTEPSVTVIKGSEVLKLNIYDLLAVSLLEKQAQFQNNLLNWRGYGTYTGCNLSTIIELVGGMLQGQILKITADDGYSQEFCYSNAYPNSSWFQYQGYMILAIKYNGTLIPEWEDGPRIAFLPNDESYSNNDCAMTSAPGQGYNVYPSAGSRWMRRVVLIEII